jgi:peroxidase
MSGRALAARPNTNRFLEGISMSAISRCALVVVMSLVAAALPVQPCSAGFRSFDGTGNNTAHPEWGSAETNFARLAPADYADGASAARLTGRPNPRSVGTALFRQTDSIPNNRLLSGYVYAFGNFLSHDTQRTVSGTTEFVSFRIPNGDDIFVPNQTIPLGRSLFDNTTGTSPSNPRQQINFTTAFIDGSQIYGSDSTAASILRGGPANPGAKLRTSNDINGDAENLLPRNAFGPAPDASFVAGDDRVNDNVVLTAIHTLFMREHNRLVDVFASAHPDWSSEELYQRARKMVGAELQSITFNEFLPALLGPYAPTATGNYDANLNPAVFNEFPTVFLRVGHSMLTNEFKRVQNDGQPAPGGSLLLEEAFENPAALATSADLDLFLKGLSVEIQEETDMKLVEGMRVALLDAFDIQRARDHGIPDYNTLRAAYGLSRVTSLAQITSDVDAQNAIAAVYPDINTIDPLVGVLAEDHLPGASVGPLAAAAFRIQFERLRDGDRFWYERDPDFTPSELATLRQTRLGDIILRNTHVTNLQSNVFFTVPEPTSSLVFVAFTWMAAIRLRRN